jgi:hypothetical protein
VLFKPVTGGCVFQAPNPWVFGRSSRYLVTDAQKAELLAIITPRRRILRIAVITIAILLWAAMVATLVWAVSSHDEPTMRDGFAILALIVVPMFLALVVALQRNLRRMRRLLAGAPRTQERIARRELRRAMARDLAAVTGDRRPLDDDLPAPDLHSRDEKRQASAAQRLSVLSERIYRDRRRRFDRVLSRSRATQDRAEGTSGKSTIKPAPWNDPDTASIQAAAPWAHLAHQVACPPYVWRKSRNRIDPCHLSLGREVEAVERRHAHSEGISSGGERMPGTRKANERLLRQDLADGTGS